MQIEQSSEHEVMQSASDDLKKSPADRLSLWLGLALVILCAIYASQSRLAQLAAWKNNPEQYVASGVPMMTTLDAYYSLRLARLYTAGGFIPHGPVPARHYSRPEPGDPNDWYDQREPKVLPLLSRMLSMVAPLFASDIDHTALVFSPLLSSLFMLPLFWYCWRLGVPAAGLMGGLVATFCLEYYQRTGVGWVDTDCLNLFFPWSVSCLILAMRADMQRQTQLILSAAVGAVLYIFFLWYDKPGLTLAYVGALAVHLFLIGVSWRRIRLCVVTMIIFANPIQLGSALGNLADFSQRYLWRSAGQITNTASTVRFAEVWSTISEANSLPWADALGRILPRRDMAIIGLGSFVLFMLWRWRAMAALGPILLFAALALLSARRFIPYLAPFVGIGWGIIVSLITTTLLSRIGTATVEPAETSMSSSMQLLRTARLACNRPSLQIAVAYLAVGALFVGWFTPATGKQFAPQPAIPAQVFRELQLLPKRLPVNSRMWTWWDNGFAIVDATGLGVYHDGAAQYTPQTNLIASSFVLSNQRAMHDIISFVDREGNRGIRQLAASASDFDNLLTRIQGVARPFGDVPIYVLYTPDMLLKYPAMRFLGTDRRNAALQRGSFGIRWLQCQRIVDDKVYCAGQTLDLRTGYIARLDRSPTPSAEPTRLRRAVLIEAGKKVRRQEYADSAELTMEIIFASGEVKGVYLLDKPAFQSNLNQMFVLGRFDATLFEEAYNDFPYARAFRVLTPPQ